MADRYQGRPFPADDDDRGGDQHDTGGSDPLAELARLIGQTDPFGTMGKSNVAPPPPPVPRASPRYEPPRHEETQYEEQQYDEPVEEEPPPGPPAWMQRANVRAVPQQPEGPAQEDIPSAVHPLRRHALPAPQYEDYPEEQAYQEAEQHADPSRYDDALYGQLQGGGQDYQRDAAYPDDPYAYQDGYEDEPEPVRKRAGGLLTVAAVLALAVVGTGAAFAYRTYLGGPKSGDPPIIKADNTPTKVIPAPADTASKTPDRMPLGEGSEKIVPREEKPVDVNATGGAPRVVFPPLTPNANPPPASVATTTPPPAAVPTNGTLPSSEPRKIKTLSVRGDQADAGPAAPPAPAAAPAPAKPAKSAAAAPRSAPPPAAAGNAPLSLAPDTQASAPAPEPRRVATLQPPPGAPNAPTNPGATAGGGYLVQVSSQRSESDAQASYKALQSRYPAVLGSHTPLIKRADLGDKGVYYRAMVGPFNSAEEASQFCGSLKTAGGQCVVQRN
jgi:SPOR domain